MELKKINVAQRRKSSSMQKIFTAEDLVEYFLEVTTSENSPLFVTQKMERLRSEGVVIGRYSGPSILCKNSG